MSGMEYAQAKETTLRFLMDDGAAAYTFRPALAPEQYTALLPIVKAQHSTMELITTLKAFAAKHGLALVIDSA